MIQIYKKIDFKLLKLAFYIIFSQKIELKYF